MGRVFRFAQPFFFCVTTLLMVAGTCVPNMRAQDALPTPAPYVPRLGGPQDWSHQHVIYTLNGSVEDMLKLRDDPRFLHSIVLHYMREHRSQFGQPATAGSNEARSNQAGWNEAERDNNSLSQDLSGDWLPPTPVDPIKFPTLPRRNKNTKVDWSMSLGPTAGLAFGETPAVYTYNYSSPSCSNLGATPPVVGDFVVYTINAAPSTGIPGQANLVGLTNLYTAGDGTGFCSGLTGPSFLFSYAIGSGGSPLSPVLSLDGSKIAWIENRTTTTSYLHVTTWAANDGTTATGPIAPTGVFTNGACVPATDSCDFALNYTNAVYTGCPTAYAAANGHSDLYVDYSSNTGFISANNGLLYHIKNIFSTTTSPSIDFCVPVNSAFETAASSAMSGPIYDPFLNEVFITDSEKIYAYVVHASGTTLSFAPASPASYTYGNSGSNHNYQTGPGPMLDAFNGYIYVPSTYDVNGKTSVTQVPTSLASGVPVELGPESTNSNQILFYGAFDNNYYTNGPKSAASTLYSCGTDSTTTTAQDLFAISFHATTGVANTTPAMSYNKNVNPGGSGGPGVLTGLCSPITEFFDGTNDRIFVGMGQPASSGGANIVTMWNVNNQLTSASTTPTASANGYAGGASGFAADNNSSDAQAENVYFSTEQVGTASTTVTGGGTGTAFNVNGIYTNGTTFPQTGGLDDDGNAYSATLLGTSKTWNGTTYTFGPSNAADAWQNTTITLPAGQYSTLSFVGNAVNGNLTAQPFIVTYTDGTTVTYTQSVSDWFTPQNYDGESIAVTTAYRNMYNGTKDNRTFDLYGYSFSINPNKTVKSLTLPPVAVAPDNVVVVLGIALSSNCGGQDYCAVKLTQSGLQ
jgi:hypothetical protein